MICPICNGSGNILVLKSMQYWPCGACYNAGVLVQYGPKVIGRGSRK